jgi:hypothetical protein
MTVGVHTKTLTAKSPARPEDRSCPRQLEPGAEQCIPPPFERLKPLEPAFAHAGRKVKGGS